MSEQDHLYVLVRVRKSGSQSLITVLRSALPDSRFYPMPPEPPLADRGVGLWETFRRVRRQKKRLGRLFKTCSYPKAWEKLDAEARPDDVVWGHFPYGFPQLPSWNLRYITLIRNPLDRLYSEYRYCRQSHEQRPAWRRLYSSSRIRIAGRGSFGDYIDFLDSQGDRFANQLVGYITNGRETGSPYDFLRENYFHYGVLERMETFARQLSEKMGVEASTAWQNKTRDPGAMEREDYDRDKVQRLIGRDLELYRAVLDEVDSVS